MKSTMSTWNYFNFLTSLKQKINSAECLLLRISGRIWFSILMNLGWWIRTQCECFSMEKTDIKISCKCIFNDDVTVDRRSFSPFLTVLWSPVNFRRLLQPPTLNNVLFSTFKLNTYVVESKKKFLSKSTNTFDTFLDIFTVKNLMGDYPVTT
jgi:hypothetical protein